MKNDHSQTNKLYKEKIVSYCYALQPVQKCKYNWPQFTLTSPSSQKHLYKSLDKVGVVYVNRD